MSEEEDAAAIGRRLAAAGKWVTDRPRVVTAVIAFALGCLVTWLL